MCFCDTCQMPKIHTMSRPISVSSVTVGENSDHTVLTRSLTSRLRLLASRKRCTSRRSWANALTTRMPGMVSASTLMISDQIRSTFSKPWRSRSRTTWIIHMMNGSGTRVANASHGLIDTRIAAVMAIISTSVAKSSRCSDRNTQMRSVSLPMRAIRSPVRLPPKYSSESCCKCS
ncbi:Uncharacterised protein [Bordetella pertussis]|nr:Uncharacterised protein [Bordetella pertussis]CPK80039.1 Uncharacterised protein [Bordetella pertussis]CPM66639.1 Uncharacterised protein [Bordetella pertussis]